MKIPDLHFELPEINYDFFQSAIKKQAERLKEIIKRSGTNSDAFKSIRNKLNLHIKSDGTNIEKYITTPLAVRALTDLWLDKKFNNKCPVSETLINSIYNVNTYPGTIAFIQLIRLYFMRYDLCGNLDSLINGLNKGLPHFSKKKKISKDLTIISQIFKKIISKNAPDWIVNQAIKQNIDLVNYQDQMGLSYYFSGRFGEICKNHYYLNQLNELHPNQTSSILSEIIIPRVYNSPYKKGRTLGHEILSILIDKAPVTELCQEWQDVILEIAGDPRIPKSDSKFLKWWENLGEKRINKVRGWLSKIDLKLFLEVLENYGVSSGSADLQRMFPARKKFLEGLYKQKLIYNSRLFTSTSADVYIRKYYKESELPQYAICSGQISVLYLNIQGYHVVEGSHSFALWIYDKLPPKATILNYGQEKFFSYELGVNLSELYNKEFGKTTFPIRIVHQPNNLRWQRETIKSFEKLGIKINPESVFSEEDYKLYKKLYGLSY